MPAQDPKIAIAVLVEHGCHGSSAAAPVAAKIAETYMKKYQPAIYAENLAKEKIFPCNKDTRSTDSSRRRGRLVA